jgi:hypothetical protein
VGCTASSVREHLAGARQAPVCVHRGRRRRPRHPGLHIAGLNRSLQWAAIRRKGG